MTVVLLGPQRFRRTAADVVRAVAPDGPVATVTAGWREREPADTELDELLGGRTVNLALFARRLDVLERDPALAAAHGEHREVIDELAGLYLPRLHHAVEAVDEVRRHTGRPRLREEASEDALEMVRSLDERHLARIDEAHAEFHAAWPLHERPAVAEHRAAVTSRLAGASVVALAGGHVDVLLDCLHLFNLAPGLGARHVVAWSAGAMAATERVVLFHDRAPHSSGYAEVYGRGLALCRDVVALPDASRRLRLEDRGRMAVLARRFAPARCVLLDSGEWVDCGDGNGCCPPGTRTVGEDGTVPSREAA